MGVVYYANYFVWFEVGRSVALVGTDLWRSGAGRGDAPGHRSTLSVSRFRAL